MNMTQKRVAVINMFGGSARWMAKVQAMSDAQVTAIYLRKLNDKPKPIEQVPLTPESEPTDEQLALDLGF